MENSQKMFVSQDNTPKWYLAMGNSQVGPLTANDIAEKIQKGEITWAHYIWKKGLANWQRICDTAAFKEWVPTQPKRPTSKQVQSQASQKSTPTSHQKIWFLTQDNTQYGPFSAPEIEQFLKAHKIHPKIFAWRNGMANWTRLSEIPDFQQSFPKPEIKRATPRPKPDPVIEMEPDEQRETPRRPLVAKILVADDRNVIVGVCRDISIGGMQVLTDPIPGKVGTLLKMNISPSTAPSGKPIEAFVAEGVIVRILEDGRGFSFRFEKLTEPSKKAIEAYIQSRG